MEDIVLDNIEPSYSGRYTMEFWFMTTNNTLSEGLHIIWKNQVAITMKNSGKSLISTCWPRHHKIGNLENIYGKDFETLKTNNDNEVANYISQTYNNGWIFVRCAINHSNQTFYLDVSDKIVPKNLNKENLVPGTLNDIAERYYWQVGDKTSFKIVGGSKNKETNIYFRTIALFKEYLPKTMNMFKQYDLSDLPTGKIPYLSSYISFTNFDKDKKELTWLNGSNEEKYTAKGLTGVTLDFHLNSSFNMLCSLKRKEKNDNFSKCTPIASCLNTTSLYCTDENVGLICKDGYSFDPNLSPPNCVKNCSNFFRGPTNFLNGFICNLPCGNDHQKCSNLNMTELSDIKSNISCKTGYKRVNYNCIDEKTTKNSYMYFSSCLNTPNMIMDLNLKSFFLSVWIKFDKPNEFCSTTKTKKFYFVAYPHIIYSTISTGTITNEDTLFYYENIKTGNKVNISNLVNFNWNIIIFHYNENTKTFLLIINNKIEPLAFSSKNAEVSSYELQKIVFCVDNSKCKNNKITHNLNDDFVWGSAYYKNLKIYDGIQQNFATFQEKEQNLKDLTFVPKLRSLNYDIPMNVFNTEYGDLKGISPNNEKLEVVKNSAYSTSVYYKQIDEFFHYSSKLAVFTPKDKYYFSARDSKGALTENQCQSECLKCVQNNMGCLICNPGYKLIGNKCHAFKKMYLSIPSENTSNGSIELKTTDTTKNYDLSNMNALTLSITLRINGLVYSTSNNANDCFDVIILTSDKNRKVCYLSSDDSLNLMEGGISAFKYVNFSKFFGQFIVISISFNSKYIYDKDSKNYKVDPTVSKYWRNYYSFYINEIPVPSHRQFDYDNKINTIPLYFNKLQLGQYIWAYMNEINVYKGFYTNPFSLVTHNNKIYLVKTYSFTTAVQGDKNFISAPLPTSQNKVYCLDDSLIDFTAYNGITSDFAYNKKFNCVSDLEIRFEKKCSGNTFFEIDSQTPKCSSCSISCPSDCAFKGINGCTANSLDSKIYQKYTNYDSTTIQSKTSDINTNYYFSNDIESRKVNLLDMSKFSSASLKELKVRNGNEYSTEFWFHIHMYGLGGVSKSNSNKPIPFDKQDVIWDKHNKITIENINNEIYVTCYPLFNNIDKNSANYKTSMDEYEKYKISRKMSELIYKKTKWVYVNCSTNLSLGKANLNDKEVEFKINIDDSDNNPYQHIYKINNKSINTTDLIIQKGELAKTNYGLFIFEELRLWNTAYFSEKSPDCLIDRPTSYKNLLHGIRFDDLENLVDFVTSEKYSLLGSVNPDYKGINILDTVFDMNFLKKDINLKTCLYLNVIPLSGNIDVTSFIGSVYVPKEQMTNSTKSLSIRKIGTKNKIDISSSLVINEESISFSYVVPQSLVQINSLDKDGFPINLEFIFGLKEKSENYTKFTFAPFSLTSEEVKTEALINDIKTQSLSKNTTATTAQIVTSANLIENLVNSKNFTESNENKNYNTSVTVNNDGTLTPAKSVDCNDEYCSFKGKCSFSDEFKTAAICTCIDGYLGVNCELTKEKSELIKNFTVSAIESIQNSLVQKETVIDPVTGATVVKETPKEIQPSVIKAVGLHIKNGVKAIDSVEDANKFNDVIETILDNKNEKSTENVVKSKDEILDMISNMFDFSNNQIQKAKQSELTSKRLGKYRQLTFEDKMRILQTSTTPSNSKVLTPEEIYKKKVNLIITNEESNNLIDKLGSNFAEYFNSKFSSLVNSTNNDTLTFLKAQNMSEFTIEKDDVNFQVTMTPIINIDEFDFIKYFDNRIKSGLSYMDPKECLKSYMNSFIFRSDKRNPDPVMNSIVFALYIYYKNPMFTISDDLLKRAVSNTHRMVIYDIKGNSIKLENCVQEIQHYLPLAPRDNIFLERFNVNPKKYDLMKSQNLTSINDVNLDYMPIYIAPNGTIYKGISIKENIEKNYPTYKFYLSQYDVKNVTVYNITINFNKVFVDMNKESVKFIENSKIYAASRTLGNMGVMSTYDPPTNVTDKYYFLKNENVVKVSTNWEGNWCFIALTILFALNFIFVIVFLIFGCLAPKMISKNNQVFKMEELRYDNEYILAKKDDLIFDPDMNLKRNNIYSYLYQAQPLEKSETEKKADVQKEKQIENEKKEVKEKQNDKQQEDKPAYGQVDNNEQQGIELQNVNVEINENKNVDSAEALKSQRKQSPRAIEVPKTNSLLHFILKRNIYSNLFNLNSPFNSTWKFFSKLFTLIYLLLFFCTCLFIYSGIDFNPNDSISYGAIAQSIFLSILISNVAFTLINIFYSSFINNSRITNIIKNNFVGDLMSSMNTINIVKFIFMNILSLFIFAGTFYLSFCLYAVYAFYGNQLIVAWLLTIVFDFIVMEILLEIFISILKLCKGSCFINSLIDMMVGIKNFRNGN
jgi:hypothetical protein